MPRAGLDAGVVVAAAAELADEIGFPELTMARLADRLGVRTPSLYKHVASQEDLHRRIAVLALDEVADAVGAATQGRAGRDALGAAARAMREFVVTHPGRYAATIGLTATGPDDPMAIAAIRGLGPFSAVLRGYDVPPEQATHALRALRSVFHGFATLQATGGFQWAVDVDESFEWLIDLIDRGLRATPTDQPADTASTTPSTHHR
ncbi:TetR-like C-terminal domain-containing protein [Modestobacter versicolor]|uniref:AcrR family transcriptional regulator n=1 Tax=Modestobacter versicolor TaxID=429133 RepID=A0A323VK89_9ACTN|nr:TetR-like C-terminal domain-containing protein [Modestobacter versicolor]MBB3674702.1 AcrR family transcriptional regulator [Modestobacter versicolor]PZA23236.1 TetR/AcrR family transcriptional regulator [Modestobacter versicolor]